jgi:hypothetical protein
MLTITPQIFLFFNHYSTPVTKVYVIWLYYLLLVNARSFLISALWTSYIYTFLFCVASFLALGSNFRKIIEFEISKTIYLCENPNLFPISGLKNKSTCEVPLTNIP